MEAGWRWDANGRKEGKAVASLVGGESLNRLRGDVGERFYGPDGYPRLAFVTEGSYECQKARLLSISRLGNASGLVRASHTKANSSHNPCWCN